MLVRRGVGGEGRGPLGALRPVAGCSLGRALKSSDIGGCCGCGGGGGSSACAGLGEQGACRPTDVVEREACGEWFGEE